MISDSEILLTIKGNNTQQILNNKSINLGRIYTFGTKPSEIIVNGEKINKIDYYIYNLSLEINNITIKFNQILINCNVMFYGLSNITNIKFINFNTSSVTSMRDMFYECNDLISLDLSHFDTSSVTYMYSMFYDCNNLISLDLSNFNTLSVKYAIYVLWL